MHSNAFLTFQECLEKAKEICKKKNIPEKFFWLRLQAPCHKKKI